MMKKRLRKRSERGQAVSELVISLIGVSLIVLGTIMVSVMGISGIRNLIDTRSEAERKMNANAFGDVQANHITEWVNIRRNDGAGLQFADPRQGAGDGIQFTEDDTAVTSQADGSVFMDTLNETENRFSTSYLASTSYAQGAFEPKLELSNIFVSAADLTSARKTVTDPPGQYELSAAARALQKFGIHAESFKIEDTVFMPRTSRNESE